MAPCAAESAAHPLRARKRAQTHTHTRATQHHPRPCSLLVAGAYHAVENISQGTTKFLQIFDHPQGGAVFAAPALVALPRNIVNSAFSVPVLPNSVTGNGAIIAVTPCSGNWS